MVIAHNISASNTYRAMGIASTKSNKSMEKLSSGYRINRAGDDAAGLSISEKMRAQIRGLNQAKRNAEDGVSMIQTAEGALNESHSILQRMRELAVQAANDTNENVDRDALQNEMNQLTSEINRIGNTTEFNNMKLLDGSKQNKIEGGVPTNIAKGGSIKSFTSTKGVTKDASFKLNSIKFGDTAGSVHLDKLVAKTDTNKIKVTADATNDKFLVDVDLYEYGADLNTPGTNYNESAKEMIKQADGSYKYDSNGISFSISKEDAATMLAQATNSTLTLDLYEYIDTGVGAAVNVKGLTCPLTNDYSVYNKLYEFKDFNLVDFGSGESRLDYDHVEIEVKSAGATKAEASVKFINAGAAVVTDTFDIPAGELLTDYSYNANGISFKIKGVAVAANAGTKLELDLDDRFGTDTLITGGTTIDNSAYFHVGANKDQTINMEFNDMRAAALGIVSLTAGEEGFSAKRAVTNGTTNEFQEYALDLTTRENANLAIEKVNNAIQKVSTERSKYGAIQNRIEYTVNNLQTTSENLQSAESRIRDVDMASEMMEMTKNNILQQASQSMLTQAMQRPQQVLQLLQQ